MAGSGSRWQNRPARLNHDIVPPQRGRSPMLKTRMRPPHPGAFIREEILSELGLTVAHTAEILKVRRATLSDLLNGKAALSPEMALRIEKRSEERRVRKQRVDGWTPS